MKQSLRCCMLVVFNIIGVYSHAQNPLHLHEIIIETPTTSCYFSAEKKDASDLIWDASGVITTQYNGPILSTYATPQNPARYDWLGINGSAPVLMHGRYKISTIGGDYSFTINLIHCNIDSPDRYFKYIPDDGFYIQRSGVYEKLSNHTEIFIWEEIDEPCNTTCLFVPLTVKNEFKLSTGGTTLAKNLVIREDGLQIKPSPSTLTDAYYGEEIAVRPYYYLYNDIETGNHHIHERWNDNNAFPGCTYYHDNLRMVPATVSSNFSIPQQSSYLCQTDGIASEGLVEIKDPWKTLYSGPNNDIGTEDNSFVSRDVPIAGLGVRELGSVWRCVSK